MERRIDPDARLDYVEIQIFPSHNRYEACVSTSNRAEKVASGSLEQLLLHSPQVKDFSSKGSNSNFKILPPDDVNDVDWFTMATLTRFLHIVGSPDIPSIGDEISQLEETRKFQLSLFAKAEGDMTSSFESKNELLRAVDLRLSTLKEKLADALNQATGIRCSPKDISDLENFTHHFGAEDIRDSLQKFVELSQSPSFKDSANGSYNKTERNASNPPVKYGVSPAKAAEIERQSSTDSETSFSSEGDQPSIERSRTITRSATPKRAASPMRRVQIGRSGSRRPATLSIRSLKYHPSGEKTTTQRDAAGNSSEEEESGKPAKNNVLRMSVQDKISLFERKQNDQGLETQKTKTLSTAAVANKTAPRRWSSGMGESAIKCFNNTSNDTSSPLTHEDLRSDKVSADTAENVESCSPEKGACESLDSKADTLEHREGSGEKQTASTEWSQQKEAELNQLFTKMMETKPVRQRNATSDNSKSKNSSKEQRGGFYDHYKQKRDEKLRKEASGKRAEKEAQFKEMQQFLDDRKAEMASTNTSDVGRRHTINKPQNTQKNSTQSANSRKEASKPSAVKKTTSKPSQLPATRKSWPSTPSPKGATRAPSPARTPSGTTSTSATPSRKPQSASSTVRSTTKVDKSQPRSKTLKPMPPDANKSVKTVTEKKQPVVAKGTKTAKSKVRTEVGTPAATPTTTPKPSFYNKVTKKSSVVPLETKPFLRKGSGIGPGVGPVVAKSKVVAQPEENLIQAEEILVVNTGQNQEECEPPQESCAKLDSEPQVVSPIKREESKSSNQFDVTGEDCLKRTEIPERNTETEEESMISPTAWVEVEEDHQDEIIPCKESPIGTAPPANLAAPGGALSPRVRHSLFQMLLEETSEADSCEWGNAEHPPAMVYQKDAPKGFKRLLKFARKNKADSHLTGCSSPSGFSEGEDDSEESKGQSDLSRLTVQNHQKIPETKAARSFFSSLRGNKTSESKLPNRYG